MIYDDLQEFLARWNDDSPTITVHTSGSTGLPKAIEVEKERMRASARMTCDFLDLKEEDTALLCMPLRFIAGMMMVVRSIERSLRLIVVEPSSHPLSCAEATCIDFFSTKSSCRIRPYTLNEGQNDWMGTLSFAAMVPSQVYETVRVPDERERFMQIKHTIIGGGAIDPSLEAELCSLIASAPGAAHRPHVWHSYGMTETLSHIAMRPIGEKWFTPLPGVHLSEAEDACLIIDAPHVCPTLLHTNDIVKFCHHTGEFNNPKFFCPSERSVTLRDVERGFRILGRKDNTICSGGIKIQIEEVEAALHPIFGNTIQVTSLPHPKFGEVVVFLTTKLLDEETVRATLTNPYWLPKHIFVVDELPKTATGKPDRAKAKEIASYLR